MQKAGRAAASPTRLRSIIFVAVNKNRRGSLPRPHDARDAGRTFQAR